MTKFAVLTSEAKAIVTNFFNAQKKSNIFCEPHKQLMVSLYGLMPDANPTVVDILCQYVVSLSDFMSESDIRLLKSEYSAVIRFCYDNREFADVTRFNEGEQFIPKSLIDLCLDIAEPKAGSSVLVPYAGDGSLHIIYQTARLMVLRLMKLTGLFLKCCYILNMLSLSLILNWAVLLVRQTSDMTTYFRFLQSFMEEKGVKLLI